MMNRTIPPHQRSRTHRVIFACGLLMLIGAVAAAACGDDDPSREEAATNLCNDLDQFASSFTSMVSLDIQTATIDDIQDAKDAAREDLEEVADSASDVAGARDEELDEAYDDLSNAVNDIDDDQSVPDAIRSIAPEIQQVTTAWEDVFSSIPCDSPQQGGDE